MKPTHSLQRFDEQRSHVGVPRIPVGLEIRDLRLVDAVATHGSLTRAGTTLNVTQSALSHQLADLERRFGAALFLRMGRRMVPTPAGERLREWARSILVSVTRAEDDVNAAIVEREGLLRLTTQSYTAYHWLPIVLRRFRQAYPRVETRVLAAPSRRPFQALLRGDVDVAMVHSDRRDRRIRMLPLFRDELVVVVSRDHRWSEQPFVDIEEFAAEHLLLTSTPAESPFYHDILREAGVAPRQTSEVHLTEAVIELVRADLGVSVLARWAIGPAAATGDVTAVRITRGGIHRQWWAASMRRRNVPAYEQAFLSLLRCKDDGAQPAAETLQRGEEPLATAS